MIFPELKFRISSIFIKKFLTIGENCNKSGSFLPDHSLWENIFLAMMRNGGYPLSATVMAPFYYPQQIGNSFRKWWLMSTFTKKSHILCKILKIWRLAYFNLTNRNFTILVTLLFSIHPAMGSSVLLSISMELALHPSRKIGICWYQSTLAAPDAEKLLSQKL